MTYIAQKMKFPGTTLNFMCVKLVYIISPVTSQLRTNLRKVTIKYVGPLVVYQIVDSHHYLLMTLDGNFL